MSRPPTPRRGHRSCRLRIGVVAVAALTTTMLACGAPTPTGPIAVPDTAGPTFPRTGTYFLDQHTLPPVDELARYDVVVIDHEWAHRVPRQFFAELAAANPRLQLLAYVNLIDLPDRLGSPGYWADRYALWQFRDPTRTEFPPQWLATTADGHRVSEWPDSTMANLADIAPTVGGRTYAEYAAEWVVEQVWATGLWDGIFLDVWGDRVYGADRDAWDVDGDGDDETADEIYGATAPWGRGLRHAEAIMRSRMPGAILVANSRRGPPDTVLDGRAWESFADPLAGRDPVVDFQEYVALTWAPDHAAPGLSMTINRLRAAPGSAEEFRRARFFLTATLMQNGYWAPTGPDYHTTAYYDEMDGGGLGRGYLGHPLVPDPSPLELAATFTGGVGAVHPEVYRRDFEGGIVVVNTGIEPHVVRLERPYRHLRGTQDPERNNGATVTSVTIPARDGIVLLREAG